MSHVKQLVWVAMKIIGWPALLFALGVFPLVRAGAAAENCIVAQRADGCVVMDGGDAQVEGKRSTFAFEITHPGEYTVQVVTRVEQSKGSPSAAVDVNGKPICNALEKAYVIEDGVVSCFEKSAVFTEAGKHRLSLQSTVAPAKVRLVPQMYAKSRIQISSSKYYDPWLAMHRSPEKQAALARFHEARFGMFIHWGAYSVAAGSWKGVKIEDSPVRGPRVAEWLMFTFNIPREEYREFAEQFNPDKSFAANIARLARETGMKYVVITAKHHDGFSLFDSACSDFDVTDGCCYDGDLIKALYDACRAEGLDFGVYYSHGHDWMDGCDGNYAGVKKYNDSLGVPTRPNGKNLWDPSPNRYGDYLENKAYPQIAELIRLMPDLRLIWFDGEGLITEAQAFRFYKMIYDLNPGILVNRRIGYDFGDYVDAGDNKTPSAKELAAKHFETCGTANRSWGFKAHDENWKSANQLLRNFVDIVSKGGNYLLNIGPDGKGRVPAPCVDSFREMGVWVKTNEEAIFGADRWTRFNEGVVAPKAEGRSAVTSSKNEFWFSARDNKVYAMSLTRATGTVRIESLKRSAGAIAKVRVLGNDRKLKWNQTDEALEVDFTGVETGVHGYAVEVAFEETRKRDGATKRVRTPKYLETGGRRKLEVLYKRVSGKDLHLDLYYPTENRAAKCPVVVFTHGGGWAAGNRYKAATGNFETVFLRLIKEGFAVAPVTYRLAKKDSNVAMRDCVVDCKDAIRYLSKHSESLGIDPMRVYVMGDSAGGHIAQMLLLSSPESLPGDPTLAKAAYRMAAGVSWYGPCDFEKTDLFNHDDRPDFRDRFGPRILGSDSGPQDKPARYREMSPINYLTPTSPPLLMIQGDKDTTIPVRHAYYMQEKAATIGAPVEILIVKNSGHNWRRVGADIEPSRQEIVDRTVRFFVDHQ